MQELTIEKNQLRSECKRRRRAMSAEQKNNADSLIFERTSDILGGLMVSYLYCYVSSPEIEVDTLKLIDMALGRNIPVVVPKCVTHTCRLEHYIISSRKQLETGSFGIMEPDPEQCERKTEPHEGICIVPGLAFDAAGVRMGYGKGYYDRFLENFKGLKIGLCYENCFYKQRIPYDRYDAVMDMIVTERKVRKIYAALTPIFKEEV